MSRTSLTNADRLTLKAAILADPALAPLTSGQGTDYNAISIALNTASATRAWRTGVPAGDSDDAPDMSTFDALTAGKRDSWALFLGQSVRDFGRNKVRKWITDIWGNATANSNAEAILLAGTEFATRAEVIIGGNTKTTGTVTGLDRNWTGTVSLQDVAGMFNV
jgi:hypothetical protein